ILHRDIKPANVKITSEGRVKVLDFGLGKATLEWERDHSTETMPTAFTQAGFIVGTPAYMSPEQIRGQAVDTRADVWAFGCLVYELLTGRRPFEGDTVVEIAAAVLRADPDWTLLPAATPSAARALLKSCLEKNLQARLSDLTTARSHLEGALREGVAGSKTERTPMSSVVVLPFANVSGDPEMDYLSDGLTESIITSLSQVAGLRVMSRTAVVRYKGRAHQAQDIGRELGVAAVLTGSVLQRNDMLVITTELVDVDRGWQ